MDTVSRRHGYRREGTKNGLLETWIPSLGDMDTGGRGSKDGLLEAYIAAYFLVTYFSGW